MRLCSFYLFVLLYYPVLATPLAFRDPDVQAYWAEPFKLRSVVFFDESVTFQGTSVDGSTSCSFTLDRVTDVLNFDHRDYLLIRGKQKELLDAQPLLRTREGDEFVLYTIRQKIALPTDHFWGGIYQEVEIKADGFGRIVGPLSGTPLCELYTRKTPAFLPGLGDRGYPPCGYLYALYDRLNSDMIDEMGRLSIPKDFYYLSLGKETVYWSHKGEKFLFVPLQADMLSGYIVSRSSINESALTATPIGALSIANRINNRIAIGGTDKAK